MTFIADFTLVLLFIVHAGYRLGDTEAESSQPLPETISNRQSNSQQQTVSFCEDLLWNYVFVSLFIYLFIYLSRFIQVMENLESYGI